MYPRTVLYVVHNHPSVKPGGAETYALELHEAMRDVPGFRPVLLAATGPPDPAGPTNRPGTLVSMVDRDSDQYFFHTDASDFDWLQGTARNKDIYTRYFNDFLTALRPDVVHFQHTLFYGYDVIRQVRNALPDTAIVYTLHEYLPICHRDGQMVRSDGRLCEAASPRRCHTCFPEISPQAFFLRERLIKSHLSLVDLFLAPSRFLLERYVDWGIPRSKLRQEDNGRPPALTLVEPQRPARNRVGFFGQFTPFKGVDILLQAMRLVAERRVGTSNDATVAHLWLHGANLDDQHETFQAQFQGLLQTTADNVTLLGSYRPRDLPRLMAEIDWVIVPSVWWENAPLVIQEAFQHGRPVICSDIGGMAEKVVDGVNGLHFSAGDPPSLAAAIERATTTPGLWERLREGIPEVHSLQRHVTTLTGIYEELLTARIRRGGIRALR